ncbi:MAG: porin family protein [Hyphomonas sp.]|nr:porin family protein [Hyphomonas sp.]
MKTFLPTLMVTAALAVSPAALAEGWYADGGYTHVTTDVDTGVGSADIDLGALSGRLGYDFHPNFGVEGELAFGVNDEEATQGGVTASLGLNYLVGAYGKAQLPVAENINLFARAGIVQAELEAEVTGLGSASDSETGAGYGVGGTVDVAENIYIRGDYTRYDIEDVEADAFTIGVGVKF